MNTNSKGGARPSDCQEFDLLYPACVCIREAGREGGRKNAGISYTLPRHCHRSGRRGQRDKSSRCPQNRARASIRTGRRLCENKQRSLWSAELFLLCHRTSGSTRPFIHQIACQQVSTHTHTHGGVKMCIQFVFSVSGPSAGVGRESLLVKLTVRVHKFASVFVT